MTETTTAPVDLQGRTPQPYIAVEGPIGVGKTTLAKRLAELFDYQLLLEDAHENPFLNKFYENRRQNALATQLFFLFQRVQKMDDLKHRLIGERDSPQPADPCLSAVLSSDAIHYSQSPAQYRAVKRTYTAHARCGPSLHAHPYSTEQVSMSGQ